MRLADRAPAPKPGDTVYAARQNLMGLPSSTAGRVVSSDPGLFADGIVVVAWRGHRLVALNQDRQGQPRQIVSMPIGTLAMRPGELTVTPGALSWMGNGSAP